MIDKKWLIRIGCLWDLQVGGQGSAALRTQWATVLKSKEKLGGEKDHLLPHSWVDIKLPSSAPPPHQAGEFSCPYMVKPGLSWCNGNEQKVGIKL